MPVYFSIVKVHITRILWSSTLSPSWMGALVIWQTEPCCEKSFRSTSSYFLLLPGVNPGPLALKQPQRAAVELMQTSRYTWMFNTTPQALVFVNYYGGSALWKHKLFDYFVLTVFPESLMAVPFSVQDASVCIPPPSLTDTSRLFEQQRHWMTGSEGKIQEFLPLYIIMISSRLHHLSEKKHWRKKDIF